MIATAALPCAASAALLPSAELAGWPSRSWRQGHRMAPPDAHASKGHKRELTCKQIANIVDPMCRLNCLQMSLPYLPWFGYRAIVIGRKGPHLTAGYGLRLAHET
jgi:hypothetical protein